jgi:hypothetical protein
MFARLGENIDHWKWTGLKQDHAMSHDLKRQIVQMFRHCSTDKMPFAQNSIPL